MAYTLGQAARATGKSKPTVLRSIKLGRISASKDAFGNWQIEPVELHRVYPPALTPPEQQTPGNPERYVTPSNPEALEAENRQLSERLAEKDRFIEELREDRDRWRDESDSWRKQASALLTDQRDHSLAEPNDEDQPGALDRRSWWRFWR
jgi:hypothetical protein